MRLTSLLLSLALTTTHVCVNSAVVDAPIEGYGVVEAQWDGVFQGKVYNVTGPIQVSLAFISYESTNKL